jgi:hypothetical protein
VPNCAWNINNSETGRLDPVGELLGCGPLCYFLKAGQIQLSVTLNIDFRFVAVGSDEAAYSLHDLSLRCEPLETEYDDYIDLLPENGVRESIYRPLKASSKRRITTPTRFLPVINRNRISSKTSRKNS